MDEEKPQNDPEEYQWLPPGVTFAPSVEKQAKKKPDPSFSLAHVITALIIVGLGFGLYSLLLPDENTSTKTHAVVSNSAWDGSVRQVKSWLKSNLRDPDSIEYIEWSDVVKNQDGTFTVRCKYRAKNGFGGYVLSNKIFFLAGNGEVISVADY